MKYQIEVTDTAEGDLDGILDWLLERSPQGAAAWFAAWNTATMFISESALAAPLAPENDDHDEDVRHWPFKTDHGRRYRLLFIIRENTAYITNVRGYGQKLVTKSELGKPNQ